MKGSFSAVTRRSFAQWESLQNISNLHPFQQLYQTALEDIDLFLSIRQVISNHSSTSFNIIKLLEIALKNWG